MISKKRLVMGSIVVIVTLLVPTPARTDIPTVYAPVPSSEFSPLAEQFVSSPKPFVERFVPIAKHLPKKRIITATHHTQAIIRIAKKPLYKRINTPVSHSGHSLSGTATYYAYVPGGAAAGRALRSAIGPHWRGTRVTVCYRGNCVSVVLSDYEASTNPKKIIDLDTRSFIALTGPGGYSMGIAGVTVKW